MTPPGAVQAGHLGLARLLTGTTLGFHIIFATLGVGMPLYVLLALLAAARRRDPDLAMLAHRWTRALVILVVTGAASGTLLAIELYIFWPRFMALAGRVIILPLVLEGFAFLVEAAFLSLYLYGGRDGGGSRPMRRALLWVPIVLGSGSSGFLITTMNAFMNAPAGFRLLGGRVVDVQPWVAMFNPATPTETAHVLATAYLASGMALAAVAAASLLREPDRPYFRKALNLSLMVAAPLSLAAIAAGDLAGKFLAAYQPEKLAALEALLRTTRAAPEVLFGWFSGTAPSLVDGVRLPVPGLLSYLATGRFDGTVQGLEAFPRATWPPLVVHDLFDGMVGIGLFLAAVTVGYVVLRLRRGPGFRPGPWLLRAIVLSGPLAMLAIELGWVAAEEGRQPWLLYGVMTDVQGVTTASGLGLVAAVYLPLYLALVVVTVVALRATFRRHRLAFDPATGVPVEVFAGGGFGDRDRGVAGPSVFAAGVVAAGGGPVAAGGAPATGAGPEAAAGSTVVGVPSEPEEWRPSGWPPASPQPDGREPSSQGWAEAGQAAAEDSVPRMQPLAPRRWGWWR